MVNKEITPQATSGLNEFINQAPQGPGIQSEDHYGDLFSKQSGSLSSELVKKKGTEYKGELD